MSRRRSLKDRYLGFLRRIWPAPTLAMLTLMLPLDASAARSAASIASTAVEAVPTTAPPSAAGADDELRYDWDPRLLPNELYLAPELRAACAPIVSIPPSLMLEDKDDVIDALEPIATCLTLGPSSGGQLHLRSDKAATAQTAGKEIGR